MDKLISQIYRQLQLILNDKVLFRNFQKKRKIYEVRIFSLIFAILFSFSKNLISVATVKNPNEQRITFYKSIFSEISKIISPVITNLS